MKSISVLVNARLQSSRMQNKMLRPYAGTDLLEIALNKINQLDYFDHRFLAVAESELVQKAKKYSNIEILERKPEAVVKGPHDAMITFEHYTRIPTKYFLVINACSAFLSPKTIRNAYDVFQKTDYNSYVAVAETQDWIFNSKGEAITHKNPRVANTSESEVFFRATHAFNIVDRDYFTRTNGQVWSLTPNDPHLIPMPIEEAIDVDTDLDFQISSMLYEKKFGRKAPDVG